MPPRNLRSHRADLIGHLIIHLHRSVIHLLLRVYLATLERRAEGLARFRRTTVTEDEEEEDQHSDSSDNTSSSEEEEEEEEVQDRDLRQLTSVRQVLNRLDFISSDNNHVE